MKLSKKSEYALLALIDLTEGIEHGYIKIFDICGRKNIPQKYLEQILLLLKGAGYVFSERGAAGGYRLKKDPSEISVAEIIRLIDGAIAPVESASKFFYKKTPIEQSPKLLSLFKDIRDYTSNKLEKTSIMDLI